MPRLLPARACARSAASTTASTSIRVRHRKSPGWHTRWSHGRHGRPSTSTDSVTSAGSRHGAERAASVGPYSPTIGVRVVDATCKGPLSPPMYRAARAIRHRNSSSDVSPHVRTASGRPANRVRAAATTACAASASDGPDVRMIRRSREDDESRTANSTNDANGQRRNTLPALTWMTTSGRGGARSWIASQRSMDSAALGASTISTASVFGSGGGR